MPRVPTQDNFQTQVSGQPNVQLQTPSGPTPGGIAADQASQFGAAATRTGDAIGKIALDVADQANQVRVNDARNQLAIAQQDLTYNKDYGYLTKKGASAFLDNEGKPLEKPLDQDYGEKLKDTIDNISANLGNDQQRKLFGIHAGDAAAQFHGQLEQHTLQQFDKYQDTVVDSSYKLSKQNAELNWNNPDAVGQSIGEAKSAIRSKAERAGLVGLPYDEAVLTGISAIHEGVIMSALQNNNPRYAMDYLAKARTAGEMVPDDILKVYGHITEADALQQAQAAVSQQTIAAMPAITPSAFDKLKAARTQIESGSMGDFKPDGTPVTSPAGAKYKNQVMDATAANPGFGIKPSDTSGTPQKVADEYNRVGDELLQKLVQKYGNPSQALAAYNAGSGRMDQALAKATAAGNPSAWAANLPAETQAYVAKANKILSSSSPVAPRPTELDFVNGAMARLGGNATPQAMKATREAAVTQFGVINKSINEQGQQALSAVQKWLYDNKDSGGCVANVPPELMDPLMRYAPGDARNLEAFSKAIQKGDTVTNLGRYNDVVTNMDQYSKMAPSAWTALQTELSPSDFKHLSNERVKYLNGGVDSSAEGLNRAQVNRSVDQGLEGLRIPTHPEETDLAGRERVGGIRSYVDQSIFKAQQGTGQKMSPEQINTHIHNLFATDVGFRSVLFGSPSSMKLMSMQLGDLPNGAAEGIKKALVASGNKAPTDTDVLNLYRRLHVQN